MLSDLLELNIFGFFLIFARVGSAISMMPGFGSSFVSPRFTLAIAMAISFVVSPPLVPNLPVMPAAVPDLVLLLIGEILIGAFLGTIARILISALQTAGTIIAFASSMANAMTNDAISEQQSSTISAFFMTAGLVLIFVSDLHHLMLITVIDSYSLFVPGEGLMIEDMSHFMARKVSDSFALALQTAGTIIAFASSMANAMTNDAISEQQSSTISAFFMTAGLVLIFVSDLHHLMLITVIDSYSLFVPGEGLMIEDMSHFMARKVSDSFALALQMSAPFIVVALTYYIGLGLLGRLMPQLQVFFFGMPFQLAAQLWVLAITASGILMVFISNFQDVYTSFTLE